jgi:hypothetical protein
MIAYFRGLSTRIKIYSAIAGGIAGSATMVTAVPPAWTALGLPEVASRHWVMENVHHPMKVAQSHTQRQVMELQLDLARGKRDQLDNSRTSFEIEKQKTVDPSIRATVDAQIRKIDRDTEALSDQIKSISDAIAKMMMDTK